MCCSGALMIFHSYCCVPTGTLETKHQLMRTASCFPSVVPRSCFKVSGCCFGFATQNHIQLVLHSLHLFFNKFPGSSPWPCWWNRWWRDIKNDTFRQMLKVWKFKITEGKWHAEGSTASHAVLLRVQRMLKLAVKRDYPQLMHKMEENLMLDSFVVADKLLPKCSNCVAALSAGIMANYCWRNCLPLLRHCCTSGLCNAAGTESKKQQLWPARPSPRVILRSATAPSIRALTFWRHKRFQILPKPLC